MSNDRDLGRVDKFLEESERKFLCDNCGCASVDKHICGAMKLCPACAKAYSYNVRMGLPVDETGK